MIEWISVAEYMRRTGASRDLVKKLIKDGEIISEKVGNNYKIKIEQSSIEAMVEDVKKIKEDNQMLKRCVLALCKQLNTQIKELR